VGVVKDGPPMALDHNLLYQMVTDPAFFRRVPVLFFMKEQAEACAAAFAAGECGGCGATGAMGPAMATFVRTLISTQRDAPEMLDPLVAYIAERRGYRPRPVRVYYRVGTDAPQRIEF